MGLETYSAPSPQPKPDPTAQSTQTFQDSGMVRVIETLGFESDNIDCPHCGKRVQTVVDKRPSQATKTAQVLCCVAFVPLCCVTWFIPKWTEWYFDAYHKCPLCKVDVAFIKHSQERIVPRYIRSQSGVQA